jgi:GT2 family glycosyltransferase
MNDAIKRPFVSILICSKGRRDSLVVLIGTLRQMKSSHSSEIIVVEETDSPKELEGVTYVPHPVKNRGIPYARNLALKYAHGEIVVFIDDDCAVSDGWLDSLLDPFRDDSVIGVQGGVMIPENSNPIAWSESILGFPGGGITRVEQAKGKNQITREISTLNCAYRQWVFEKVGGFEESLILGSEDFLLARKACVYGQCLFVPAAFVCHEARGSLKKVWNWFVRRGRAEIRLLKLRGIDELSFASLLTRSLICKFLLVFLAGALFPGIFAPLLMLALVIYVTLQLFRFFTPWRLSKAPVATIFVLSLVKLVMDSAMDWGRVRGLLLD